MQTIGVKELKTNPSVLTDDSLFDLGLKTWLLNSSLIMAARLGRLDLLTNLFQQIHVPQRVRQEIMAKEDAAVCLLLENPTFTVVATTNHSLLALLDGTLAQKLSAC